MPHLFLYGPPGTGKSTIGQLLAEELRLPFIDLDRLIESQAGMSIPQIMKERGETAFRELETTALNSLTLTPLPLGEGHRVRESIIALGGGALLRGENRAIAEASGKIILLTAELDTLLERLSADPQKRPLLAGGLRERLTSLLETRKEHYASFPLQLRVDGKSAEQIARQIQVLAGRHHLSAMGEYDVIVGQVSNLPPQQSPLLVTDENVAKHHLEKFQGVNAIVLPAGEEHKNLQTISRLWAAFLENGLDRKSTVIALGGGVISDLTGFAASAYMRGIDWIALPTTLLAMVDASLGGKTGIDLPEGKNLVGSFHPPKLVLADPSLLLTLSDRDLRSGMAEVVKHGVISDPELFNLCSRGMDWVKQNLETIVTRAMAVKIQVIETDPYEKGIRASLNLGHTVGHAVELVSRFELSHGEAVAVGMTAEARYAEKIGVARRGLADTIADTLSTLGLPTRIPDELPRAEILRAMRVDKKKNAKSIRFALPAEIGRVELVEVTELEEVL
ncbi:MAG: bifunctional shikimate kinase/3-dehydroquinate synthase [Anaerolineales bacterium]